MKIVNTYPALLAAYENGAFCLDRWRTYMDGALPQVMPLALKDLEKSIGSSGVSWERDVLPVLNAVWSNRELRERTVLAFDAVTAGLEDAVREKFGRDLDADVILYLGLCNGAGWVTECRERTVVLLGLEKIMELDWGKPRDLCGLIYHELGHVYQAKYGVLTRKSDRSADAFLWQLFTEGIAMVFEQTLVGDPDFYHQDRNGWKAWCDAHFNEILADFRRDLKTMTRARQRYFGDWVDYRGHADVGYYLGARFVRSLLSAHELDEIVAFDVESVKKAFARFAE